MSIELENKEKKYTADIKYAYDEYKNLFICAEEFLEGMRFFLAPMVEHRDALDHLMRYFGLKNESGLSENAIKELEEALEHEIRAYFDTADYVCINVRKEIDDSLKEISSWRIKKVWNKYAEIKKRIVNVSEEIAEIRKNRTGRIEHVTRYQKVLTEVFDIYKYFAKEIEPRIRKMKFF